MNGTRQDLNSQPSNRVMQSRIVSHGLLNPQPVLFCLLAEASSICDTFNIPINDVCLCEKHWVSSILCSPYYVLCKDRSLLSTELAVECASGCLFCENNSVEAFFRLLSRLKKYLFCPP
jgi:hypothetical protein